MLGRVTARRRERMKATILRGVYEDNLRIVGKTTPAQRAASALHRAARPAVAALGFLGVALLAATSFAPQFPAGLRSAAPGPPLPEPVGVPHPVDPALFGGAPGMSLSRSYGLGVGTILIDPGHGGEDTGAIGHAGTCEKDVALDIARRLRRRLETGRGLRVLLTRDGDASLTLQDRVDAAREARADLFVSIHLNFLPKKPMNIVETFYFGPSPDAKTVALARLENGHEAAGMGEFRELLENMGQRMKLEESRALAAAIQESVYRGGRRSDAEVQDYGIKRGPFFVLHRAEVPAVLAEVSCLSNEEEETRLGTVEHREEIAASLEAGIRDYLRTRETTYDAKK